MANAARSCAVSLCEDAERFVQARDLFVIPLKGAAWEGFVIVADQRKHGGPRFDSRALCGFQASNFGVQLGVLVGQFLDPHNVFAPCCGDLRDPGLGGFGAGPVFAGAAGFFAGGLGFAAAAGLATAGLAAAVCLGRTRCSSVCGRTGLSGT